VDSALVTQRGVERGHVVDPFFASSVRSAWLETGRAARNVVAHMMRKGGSGKTTSVLVEADALSRFGLSVLVVDMDPQGNSSIGLGRKVPLIETGRTAGGKPIKTPEFATVSEVIDAIEPGIADAAIIPASADWAVPLDDPFTRGGPLFPGRPGVVGIIPAYRKLDTDSHRWHWDPRDPDQQADLQRLATALLLPAEPGGIPPHRRWDVVLIDTPPGGSLISVHAAKAAHKVLFVSPPAKFGAHAIPETMELVEDIRDYYDHPGLQVIGLILNDFVEQGRRTQRNIRTALERAHRDHVPLYEAPLWGHIPALTVIAESHDSEAPVSAFLAFSSTREMAQRVCRAAESHAIRLLEAIEHPRTAEITAAWRDARPQSRTALLPRSDEAGDHNKRGGRHRRDT
jgi:chromosome partitioning protein